MGKKYNAIIEITDCGPYLTRIVLPFEKRIKTKPDIDAFEVSVEKKDEKGNIIKSTPLSAKKKASGKAKIHIEDLYISDETGNKVNEGTCVTLYIKHGPLNPEASVLYIEGDFNHIATCSYVIKQLSPIEFEDAQVGGLVFDEKGNETWIGCQGFKNGVSHNHKISIKYAYFVPEKIKDKSPLIIWLHGAGEGGENPVITYTANKVPVMADHDIQSLFGGAYLFVPQAKTMWMDDGTGQYTENGKSMYVEALKAAIDDFMEEYPDIDRDRIYIGGDSNGGFMTMRMIVDYPGFFAAAFPVCEALFDKNITDHDIDGIRDMPIWFVHSKNDPVVNPKESAEATYKRLLAAGAKNIHFSYFDCLLDMHNDWKDEDGNIYEHCGHFAWIPLFNRDCDFDYTGQPVTIDGEKVDVFKWLSHQRR